MRVVFDRRWSLPIGILATSLLIALGIIIFGPSFAGRSSTGVARPAASEAAADCSGASAIDYACYQKRYRDLILASGVEAAFAELKDDYEKNELVKSSCHQLAHVIGHAALDLYGDMATTYARGDHFCSLGYYHAATEAVVAGIEADEIPEEANKICADLGEHQEYSIYHYACLHGLGHGFMSLLENELFEALEACDELTDGWQREHCYGGVFMENIESTIRGQGHLGHHPSKYLRADRPLYPCTDIHTQYKFQCYLQQTMYMLYAQGYDFARVFDLCATVEKDFRWACYRGLGGNAAGHSIGQSISEAAETNSTGRLCMMSEGYEARSNCVIGAVKYFVYHYDSDVQAKAFCGPFEADLRTMCLETTEGFYEKRYKRTFDPEAA